jgi:hypothetical protein
MFFDKRRRSKFIQSHDIYNPFEVRARTKKVNAAVAKISELRFSIASGQALIDQISTDTLTDESWSLIEKMAGILPLSDDSREAVRVKLALAYV